MVSYLVYFLSPTKTKVKIKKTIKIAKETTVMQFWTWFSLDQEWHITLFILADYFTYRQFCRSEMAL